MKKLWLWICAVSLICAAAGAADAQGIERGDQWVSLWAGAGGATNDTSLSLSFQDETGSSIGTTHDLGWGDESVALGAQYLYAAAPHWAFGAEYNLHFFDGATDELHAFGFAGEHMKAEVDQDMRVHNLLAVGRFTVNPQDSFRVYIPFGAGAAFAKSTLANRFWETTSGASVSRSDSQSAHSTSFTYFIGAGIEHQFASRWLWGVEGRYQSFSFDYDKLAAGLGRENLHYVTVALKIAYRF